MGSVYSIVFKGEVADGYSESDVRAQFSSRLKNGDEAVERLFSGSRVTLARNLGWEHASRTAAQLQSIGAVVYLVDANGHAVRPPAPANDPVATPAADESGSSSAPGAADDESSESGPYNLTATAKFRHLTQITETRAVPEVPAKDRRKARLRYRFDTFMAKGGGSIFKALTAVFTTRSGAIVVSATSRGGSRTACRSPFAMPAA
jgi:hypothetical protein